MPALSLANNPLGLECELQPEVHRIERVGGTATLGVTTSKSSTTAEVHGEANASVVTVSSSNVFS